MRRSITAYWLPLVATLRLEHVLCGIRRAQPLKGPVRLPRMPITQYLTVLNRSSMNFADSVKCYVLGGLLFGLVWHLALERFLPLNGPASTQQGISLSTLWPSTSNSFHLPSCSPSRPTRPILSAPPCSVQHPAFPTSSIAVAAFPALRPSSWVVRHPRVGWSRRGLLNNSFSDRCSHFLERRRRFRLDN